MKLHIGCGTIYLDGWTNVDLKGPNAYLASDRPDLVERWKATDSDYYARHRDKNQDKLRVGPLNQESVCDMFGTFTDLPLADSSVDEVLARHTFEHLSLSEARKALDALDYIMKPGAYLRLDVPDHEETLRLYRETGDEFYVRHLLGPRRNDYGFHMMSYTRERLRHLAEEHSFEYCGEEPNIHFYPAFTLRFRKPILRPPRDWIQFPEIPDHWHVAEIGPGQYPWWRADTYIDRSGPTLDAILKTENQRKILADIGAGLPMIADKEFDFVFASHILEHVEDPERAVRTISRIAKRGIVVMPSAMKESLFNFEEDSHLWLVLPHPVTGQPPIFVRHNPAYMEKLQELEVQKIMCRLFRSGPNRHNHEQRYLRRWFLNVEPFFDVVVQWEDELKIQVIR